MRLSDDPYGFTIVRWVQNLIVTFLALFGIIGIVAILLWIAAQVVQR